MSIGIPIPSAECWPRPALTCLSLLTPDQLLNSGAKHVSSSQSSQASHKDVETVQVSSSSEPSVPVPNEAQPPILPLPPVSKSFNKVHELIYICRIVDMYSSWL
ncbi:hypothetical protein Dimus_008317 [Dionaea muscipula]